MTDFAVPKHPAFTGAPRKGPPSARDACLPRTFAGDKPERRRERQYQMGEPVRAAQHT